MAADFLVLFGIHLDREGMGLPSHLGRALLARLALEERSMYRHELRFDALYNGSPHLEGPDLRPEPVRMREKFDQWFGYSMTEQHIKWLIEMVEEFAYLYASANSKEGKRPPKGESVPSPEDAVKKSVNPFTAMENMMKMSYGLDDSDIASFFEE